MVWQTLRAIGVSGCLVVLLFGCDDKDESAEDESTTEAADDVDPGAVGSQTKQPETADSPGPVVVQPPSSDAKKSDCETLEHGEAMVRVRYAQATATAGLKACQPENQTVSCNDGKVSSTGTFQFSSCELVPAALSEGDVLVLREEGGDGIGDNGQVMAFSPSTGFKGYAFDTTGVVPWYGYGLRLSYDNFAYKWAVEVGSSNADLDIEVQEFAPITAYPHTLGGRTGGAASDAGYFQGAFSEEYNTIRYVAVEDGAKIDIYSWGTLIPECQIDMPAGKHARAIYAGTQFTFYSPIVAYTLGAGTSVTGYGVARLDGGCTSPAGTPQTLTTYFEQALVDAKVTSVLQVRTQDAGGATSWKNDILVTVGPFLSGPSVRHWHYDTGTTTWTQIASPYEDIAKAVFQEGTGDLFTIEVEDLFDDILHLRRYGHAEDGGTHFKGTLFSDAEQTYLKNTSLGSWLIVMPALD